MPPLILSGNNEIKSIELVTSKGNKINNYQIFDLSVFEKNQFRDYTFNRFPFTIFRCSPSPEYNCHGMSFASRRTNIDRANDVRTILKDDGYIQIAERNTLIGDIVLYVAEDGDIMHSGMLVLCEHRPNDISNLKVLSKWGKYKEAIHPIRETDYKDYILEFYRLTHDHYEI